MAQLKCDPDSSGKPNYWPTDQNKIPDLMDFYVSASYIKVEKEWGVNSDHSPIHLTVSGTIIHKESAPRLINKLTDSRVDIEDIIKNLVDPIDTEYQLNMESLSRRHLGRPICFSADKRETTILEKYEI